MTYTPPMLCTACICCYQGCDCDNIVVCCKGSNECLCCLQDACCAFGEESLGVCLVTDKENKELCALGLVCCRFAIKKPEVLCAGVAQTCCIVQAQSFPFDEKYVGKAVCALYCVSCLPECGCCTRAPYSSKLESHAKSIKAPVAVPIKR